MSVFGDYARYYNILYRDKDYAGEVKFVLDCLNLYGCKPKFLLDLGCGTARHAIEMAQHGIAVTGVDMSETMLDIGRTAIKDISFSESIPIPYLCKGDVRTVRLEKSFDAVTSLFHVMSYQTTEKDALSELETACIHLKSGGFFFFDFWYGPGVLTDPPTVRNRYMEDEHTIVQRYARPVHRINDNIVEVHYTITLIDKMSGAKSELSEIHNMRYWFLPELRYLSDLVGFEVIAIGNCCSCKLPDASTWNAWICLKKK